MQGGFLWVVTACSKTAHRHPPESDQAGVVIKTRLLNLFRILAEFFIFFSGFPMHFDADMLNMRPWKLGLGKT